MGNVEFRVIFDNDYDFYDIDGICRNATIFWTLTPEEVCQYTFYYKPIVSEEYIWE